VYDEIEKFLKRKSKIQEKNKQLFEMTPSVKIIRDQISNKTPLECVLNIEMSKLVRNPERIIPIYAHAESSYKHGGEISFRKIEDRKYSITIISGKYRCSWCQNFRKYIEKNMRINLIDLGTCSSFIKSEG
jgi:hypothetical protein